MTSITTRLSSYVQTKVGKRSIPLHWTNLFGVVTIACLLVLFITGVILMFFYTPSSEQVLYHGSYAPLRDATVSRAFASTMRISFDIPGGLLLRQAHHWAGLLLPASLMVQLAVAFFTGGFRRPRRLAWVLLFALFVATLAGGWSGYALPDDLLSGSGLRIVEGITLGIPVVGTYAAALLFGGQFPGQIIEHLYPIHVAVVPVLLIVLVVARARLALKTGPAQFAGAGRTEGNIVGVPLFPNAAVRAGGLLVMVMAVLLLVSATVTISPIWLQGPSSDGDASAGSQPDWYTGFLDGALRLVPPGWEIQFAGGTLTLAILVPLAVIGAYLAVLALYPFIENWITGDRREHHLLDRPRNVPTRTAIGVAGIVFYGVLWGAASADIAATAFSLGIEGVILFFQIALLTGPVAAFILTRRVCRALQLKDREIVLHGFETGRVVRLPGGEYVEVHREVDRYERWRLGAYDDVAPLELHPDRLGRIGLGQRARAIVSRFFFEDRIQPVVDTTPDGRVENELTTETRSAPPLPTPR